MMIIDDGNGNEIGFGSEAYDKTLSNDTKDIEKYRLALEFVRKDLVDTLNQPVKFINGYLTGLIRYIGDVLGE